MTERSTFEARLEAALSAYADRAPTSIEPLAMARLAARESVPPARPKLVTARPWVFAALLAALLVGLIGGATFLGSRPTEPDRRPGILPSPSSSLADVTPAPVESSPEASAPQLPGTSANGVGVGPCAPMVQLLSIWGPYDPDPPVSLQSRSTGGNGYVVVASGPRADGLSGPGLASLDPTSGALTPVMPGSNDEIPDIPGYVGFPAAPGGRIVPAPDGQAIAVDEGDLGQAGCGAPVVRFAKGGIVVPFKVGTFQTVTDITWARDGSALYGILRPTIDSLGQPLVGPDGNTPGGPGTVVRWDAATHEVTDLGSPCPTCSTVGLSVSPDESRIVVGDGVDGVAVRDTDGRWRQIGPVGEVIGWTPDGLMVIDGYDHVDTLDLDGRQVTTSGLICCHGNGYGGILSPDGTTVVGSTLSRYFQGRDIVVVDVRDGTQRVIANMPGPRGCGFTAVGSADRADCEAQANAVPSIPAGTILSWSPDGRSLLLGTTEQDSTTTTLRILSLVDLSVGPSTSLTLTSERGAVTWLPSLPWSR